MTIEKPPYGDACGGFFIFAKFHLNVYNVPFE